MTKLLSANFLRLKKSALFWGPLALSFGFGAFMCVTRFREHLDYGFAVSLDSVFFGFAMVAGIVTAPFIPLFFGTEYSDGAIRNKLIVGHSRIAVYFANLITCFAAAVAFFAAYLLACAAVGIPLIGALDLPASATAAALGGSLVMTAAFCAIFTCATMNCSKKAVSAVVCLLGVFTLLLAAVYLNGRLDAPEFITGYEMSINGQVVNAVPEPNPAYLTGMKREVCQFLYDLLPTGQSIQYSNVNFTDPVRLVGLAAAVCAAFTGAGAVLFWRKDLK